jgi:DNA-damage-inducible protein J
MLHVRVDDETKAQAAKALDAIGLSMSQAVRMFLRRVAVDQSFPFELKVPNAETRAAMDRAEEMIRTGRMRNLTAEQLFDELEKAGKP